MAADNTAPGDQAPSPDPGDDREDMWGIKRQDRRWFQVLTLIGGIAGSTGLTWLELVHGLGGDAPNVMIRNIILSVGASFIAAGFVAWGLLHIKELIMAIADWIREATEKRRQRLRAEGRAEGRQEGYARGLTEGYAMGYGDSEKGNPRKPPQSEPDTSG